MSRPLSTTFIGDDVSPAPTGPVAPLSTTFFGGADSPVPTGSVAPSAATFFGDAVSPVPTGSIAPLSTTFFGNAGSPPVGWSATPQAAPDVTPWSVEAVFSGDWSAPPSSSQVGGLHPPSPPAPQSVFVDLNLYSEWLKSMLYDGHWFV